jgi:hypothetical protein
MIKKQKFVTKYFNTRANPYGDFHATNDILPIEEVVKDVSDLHRNMVADDTVYAYTTHEVWTTEHEGVEMKSEPVKFSPKYVFATKVRKIKDIEVLDRVEDGKEIYIPFTQKVKGLNPEDYWINVDGGNGYVVPSSEKHGVEVYKGRSNEKLMSFPPLK